MYTCMRMWEEYLFVLFYLLLLLRETVSEKGDDIAITVNWRQNNLLACDFMCVILI